MLGEEYLPMDSSDWTSVISKLKSANPDAIITSTAGGAPNVTLTKQLRAAGRRTSPTEIWPSMKARRRVWGADAEGIYISGSYLTNIDSAKNKNSWPPCRRSSAPS